MKEKMSKNENIEKILGSLLEGPKTNTELLTDLGMNNKQHGNISRLLVKLRTDEIIVSEKIKSPNIDDYCTQWSIISKYINFKKILEEYPGLIYKMQNSNFVIDSIINILYTHTISREITFDDTGRKDEWIERPEEPISEEEKKDFTFKLRNSLEFLEYFLLLGTNKSNCMFDLAEQLEKEEGVCKDWLKIYNENHSRKSGCYFDQIFKACVHMDILKGNSNLEANEYLIKIEQERRDVIKYLTELKR